MGAEGIADRTDRSGNKFRKTISGCRCEMAHRVVKRSLMADLPIQGRQAQNKPRLFGL